MKELEIEINYLLDTTYLGCQQIADALRCDVKYVNEVVHGRFMARVGEYL